MAKIMLAVPNRMEAKTEMPRLLREGPADLYVFPEGFLRSGEEEAMALALSEKQAPYLPGTATGTQKKSWFWKVAGSWMHTQSASCTEARKKGASAPAAKSAV